MTLYLIAHKVRGEPAFDVAIQMEMPDGPWWIIPTSGHRAYPFWNTEITWRFHDGSNSIVTLPPMPEGLRDHYDVSRETPGPDYTNRATQSSRSERSQTIPSLEDI